MYTSEKTCNRFTAWSVNQIDWNFEKLDTWMDTYSLQYVEQFSPKKIHISTNPQYVWMWPYLDIPNLMNIPIYPTNLKFFTQFKIL